MLITPGVSHVCSLLLTVNQRRVAEVEIPLVFLHVCDGVKRADTLHAVCVRDC